MPYLIMMMCNATTVGYASTSNVLKVVNSIRPSCTHAYMVNKQGAAMLLEWAKFTKNRMASDNAMVTLSKKNENFTYLAVTPRLFHQSAELALTAASTHNHAGATRECVAEESTVDYL